MTGLLFIVTGLLVECVYIIFTGVGLGIRGPILTFSSLLVGSLYSIGPSLLFLSGVAILGPKSRRNQLCLIAGTTLVLALAAWTAPRIGWRSSAWLILLPVAVAQLIAWFALYVGKRKWITAAIGSGLSSPFTFFAGGYLLYQNMFGASPFSAKELILILPGVCVLFSFVSALWLRTE